MTVKELISKLQDLDRDNLEVYFRYDEEEDIELGLVQYISTGFKEADEEHPDYVRLS